jgi:hypothetical protein
MIVGAGVEWRKDTNENGATLANILETLTANGNKAWDEFTNAGIDDTTNDRTLKSKIE